MARRYEFYVRVLTSQATTTAAEARTGKKATGLNKQNNNFARASRFFVYFFAATTRL